jgi:hypothetical protein
MSAPVRSLSPQVLNRLSQLLLMLSSEADGERANAAAAIGRLLSANGCDWHDLAKMLAAPASSASSSSFKRSDGPAAIPRDQLLELINIMEDRTPFFHSAIERISREPARQSLCLSDRTTERKAMEMGPGPDRANRDMSDVRSRDRQRRRQP